MNQLLNLLPHPAVELRQQPHLLLKNSFLLQGHPSPAGLWLEALRGGVPRFLHQSTGQYLAARSEPELVWKLILRIDDVIPVQREAVTSRRSCAGCAMCHSIQFGVPKHSLKLSPDHANIMFLALSRPAALRPRRAATCGRGGGGSGSHLCQSWLQADTRWLGSTTDIARIVPQYPKHVTRSKIPWRSQLNWNFPWVPGRISSFLALITWCQLMLRFLVQKRYTSGFSYQLMMFTPLNESIIMYIMLSAWHSPGQEWVETPFWSCNHNISQGKSFV